MKWTHLTWTEEAERPLELVLPAETEIQIWRARVPVVDPIPQAWMDLLDPREQERARAFRVQHACRQFVYSRSLLKRLIAGYAGGDAGQVRFDYREHGKPFWRNPSGGIALEFNWSHARDWVLAAFSRGIALGVDVESLRRLDDWAALASSVFSARELAELHALPAGQRQLGFLHGWIRKEAVLKATGEGLSGLKQVEVRLAPEAQEGLLTYRGQPVSPNEWRLHSFQIDEDHWGAVAAAVGPGTDSCSESLF